PALVGTFNPETLPSSSLTISASSPAPSAASADRADVVMTLGETPDPATYGQPTALSALVEAKDPARGVPTGFVSFWEENICLGTAALPGDPNNNQAILVTRNLLPGSHNIVAIYHGDENFNTATSTFPDPTLISTTTTLSLDHFTVAAGATVNLTATVTPQT